MVGALSTGLPGMLSRAAAADGDPLMWSSLIPWFEKLPFWPSSPADSGEWGERIAADFLSKERGFSVLARNWRSPKDRRDELDLVCRDGEVLVFVEVKTRSALALVSGYFAVTKRKKKALLRVAKDYLRALPPSTRPCTARLDVVEIATHLGGAAEIRHFENVPFFPKNLTFR